MRYYRDVVLDKFIIHYHKYLPELYFRISNYVTKDKMTLSAEQLGKLYKVKR